MPVRELPYLSAIAAQTPAMTVWGRCGGNFHRRVGS